MIEPDEPVHETVMREQRVIARVRAIQLTSIAAPLPVLLYLGYRAVSSDSPRYMAAYWCWIALEWVVMFVLALVQRRAARRLARLDDVRIVGSLIDALGGSSYWRWREVQALLARLIPRMTAADGARLMPRQRKWLYSFLGSDEVSLGGRFWRGKFYVVELKVAILRALEQIGDERAIPLVEKLAARAATAEVRAAAAQCLPYLRTRVEAARPSATLLRAASGDEADALLRPAQGGSAATDTLPRPVEDTQERADAAITRG